MTTHPTTSAHEDEAIQDICDVRATWPFRGDFLQNELNTHAAHALDIIEKQTGMNALLEPMLCALETHAAGRMRWARVMGHREEFIIFRDLSMLTYREPLDLDELTEEEIEEITLQREEATGRVSEFPEEEMAEGLLPAILMLDLGYHPNESMGVIFKAGVDHTKDGGHSLDLVALIDGQEIELPRNARVDALDGLLRKVFESAEELIDAARAAAFNLPSIRRPTPAAMQDTCIDEFEASNTWSDAENVYYWPPYLSRPLTGGEDTQYAILALQELGELALWADPDLPETMTLTLVSQVTSEGQPSFTYALPDQLRAGAARLAQKTFDILLADFLDYYENERPLLPVGHNTGLKSPRYNGATGLPIATIEISRPSAQRALELDQETPHSFDKLSGWVDPGEAAERHDALMSDPHPLAFAMVENDGKVFSFGLAAQEGTPQEDATQEGPPIFNMAVAGGDDPRLMAALVERAVDSENMDEYHSIPEGDETWFAYTLVVGDGHDVNLRRPMGYATVSGTLAAKPEDQLGGDICGNEITTYHLEFYLDRLALDEERPAEERAIMIVAAISALSQFIGRIAEQGANQGRHFEVDLVLGRSTESWHGAPITEGDMTFFKTTMEDLRSQLAHSEAHNFISIGTITRAEEDRWAA